MPNSNVDVNVPGEKMEYEDLVISFMIDEYLKNFIEVFDWMSYLGFPESTNHYRTSNITRAATYCYRPTKMLITRYGIFSNP